MLTFGKVEVTDNLTMLQCIECRYMAGPGYNPSLGVDHIDRKETIAAFEYHDCESEKADAEWYYPDF